MENYKHRFLNIFNYERQESILEVGTGYLNLVTNSQTPVNLNSHTVSLQNTLKRNM